MSTGETTFTPEELAVRTYEPQDQPAVVQLYANGLLDGQLDANDTGADIENIEEAFFGDEANHFWVAVYEDKVIGMIGVARDEGHTAEIRRLRVDPAYPQLEVAVKLLEAALYHCTYHNYLKLRLDTRFEKDSALDIFERFAFQHTRSKTQGDKELLEFYLDLYRKQDG